MIIILLKFKDIIEYAYKKIGSSSMVGNMEATDFHKIVQVESMYLNTIKINNMGFHPNKNIYNMIDDLV